MDLRMDLHSRTFKNPSQDSCQFILRLNKEGKSVEKLMRVDKFKKFTAYNQHTNTSAYMRITESETITERTQVYPGKPSWGRKPSQNFSLDSSTKYNTSTRL
jgi:hypothetical protein